MRYKNDPYWTTAKRPGVCAKTGEAFKAGTRIFFYPSTGGCYVGQAAEAAALDFQACAEDGAVFNGQSF